MRISKPLSQKQIQEGDLIAPGEYYFEVLDAAEEISRAGSDMIKLKLRIFVENSQRVVFDYLLEAMEFKLGHFAECTGLYQKYQEGVLSAEDCIGKSGSLKIIIQKDKNGTYPDKNSVGDYIIAKENQSSMSPPKAEPAAAPASDDFKDSDIPF